MVFADAAAGADPLAQWLGVIVQSGCFGLICYIIMFLFPKLMAEARAERQQRDQLYAALVESQETKFDARAASMTMAVRDQTIALKETMNDNAARVERAIGAACKAKGV